MREIVDGNTCLRCGRTYQTQTAQRKYCDRCQRTRHGARSIEREKHDVQFIGIDGEGVTRPDGKHEYVLLSIGNRSFYYPDGRRIGWHGIIPFLWESFLDNPTACYVGFYLGYDFSQWLKDLPENRAQYLLDPKLIEKRTRTKSGANRLPFPVEYEGWCFDIMPNMKRFRLWKKGSDLRMYICDTGAFFQTSFLNAINPKSWPTPIVTDDEFKKIAIGKSERGVDKVSYGTPIDPEMIEYNLLENEVLSRLMTEYNRGLVDIGIRLKRDQWFGPGQVAQTWMNTIRAPKREDFEAVTDIEIRKALRASYYGGWFEIFSHGHVGTAYSYDINSAYPNIQSRLPCCLHGHWSYCNKEADRRGYYLVKCHVEGSSRRIGAAPYRAPSGHILRPNRLAGWYWWHELNAGVSAGIIDTIDIEESWEYQPCQCSPPFADERTLYLDRLRIGKNSVQGKARKLTYNSAYGKTAQSVGVAKYANMFYASLITSMCRTQILEAIATHPIGVSNVLMVATDSVTFCQPHTSLPLDNSILGYWTEAKHSNLTLFMPGIYWDDKTRNKLKDGQHPSLKSRGIPARALTERIFEIDELFTNTRFQHSGDGWPTIHIPIHLSIVSPKQALARNKWYLCGHIEFDSIRTISADPSNKRAGAHLNDNRIDSWCYNTGPTLETTPYTKTFGDEQLRELDEQMMPDGEMSMLVADIFREGPG